LLSTKKQILPRIIYFTCMLFQFGYQSSLLLIFFVHGLVYSCLLFRKGSINETRSDKWLGLFLVLCILYIAPWMLGFAGWYDNQPYRDILFYIPFQHLYFVGPVIFFYVQSLLNPSFRFDKKQWLHFLPGFLYLLFSLIIVLTDKVILKKYFFLANGNDPDFDSWYQITGFVSMLFYFLLCLRYYNLYKKLIYHVISYADSVSFRWVKNFLLAFFIILCAKLTLFIVGEIVNLWYADTWWYFIFFALLFYYIAISGYSNSVETKMPFRPNLINRKPALFLNYNPIISGNESPDEDLEIIEIESEIETDTTPDKSLIDWKQKILGLLQHEKAYEDPELSLTQVAKQLQTNPSVISMAVNKGFGLNFNDFVNQFRIERVKQMLEQGEHKKQTLLGIAFECGFNSKATFNRAFKKATGLSPKEWIQKM
jgi:AraC-like DNA-binding protein